MSGTTEKFDKRIGRVRKTHEAMSRGYTFRVEKSGLIKIKPKHTKPGFPFGGVVAVLAVGLLFKAVVFASYGPEKYSSKVALLKSGTVVEQGSAWLLEPGKPTYMLASFVGGIIR